MSAQLDSSFFGIYENIVLTKQGAWLSNGEEIAHERTVQTFSKNVFRSKDGFEIRLGTEHKTIHVEDTVYFVTGISGTPEVGFELSLNDGRRVSLDATTLRYRPGRLTCQVLDSRNEIHEDAKFLNQAYYQLLNDIEKTDAGFILKIQGKTVVLSKE
jgi:hypothetical protein